MAAQIAVVEIAMVSPLPVSVDVANAGACASTLAPHITQNLAPTWSSAPHFAQVAMRKGYCPSFGSSAPKACIETYAGRMVTVIGHRGASGYRPEHTRSAYLEAIRLGADAVEPDLVPTGDGILVVRHEPEISGTTDVADHPEFADRYRTVTVDGEEHSGWFTVDFTWAELSTLRARERLPELRPDSAAFDDTEPILRFSDLLDLLDGTTVTLVAEIKHPGLFASLGYDVGGMLLEELGDRVPADRLVVECFELPALVELHERGLAATYVYLSESPIDLAGLPAVIDGVSYDKALLLAPGGAALVRAAHAAGLLVYTWTLRAENAFLDPRHRLGDDPAAWGDWRAEYAEVLATGVDGVFADQPDLVNR